MIRRRPRPPAVVAVAFALLVAAGCKEEPPRAAPPPPKVTVTTPEVRQYAAYEDFNGWTAAVATVEIRARVRGHLEKVHFEDGELVKAGDVLFSLDSRPFKADVDAAIGKVKAYEAQLVAAEKQLDRLREVVDTGAVTQRQVDAAVATVGSLEASAESQKRVVDRQRLDVEYCTIDSPIAGRIGRALLTEGNLVNAGGSDPLLATVVSVDPIDVYFTVPERTLLEMIERRVAAGGDEHKRRLEERKIPFQFGLDTDRGYPRDGILDFANNTVDAETGTITLRGRVKNAEEALVPGMRTRVRLVVGKEQDVTVVPDIALLADMDRRYVLVVGADGKVVRKDVLPGRLLDDGMRILLPAEKEGEGVTPTDRVIVHGQQRARIHYPVEALDTKGEAVSADAPASEK